jgi:hypothetical protein
VLFLFTWPSRLLGRFSSFSSTTHKA